MSAQAQTPFRRALRSFLEQRTARVGLALLLVLVTGFVGLIPCIGWLLAFIVALFAVGGVVMTWFGTRAAPGRIIPPPVEVPPAS